MNQALDAQHLRAVAVQQQGQPQAERQPVDIVARLQHKRFDAAMRAAMLHRGVAALPRGIQPAPEFLALALLLKHVLAEQGLRVQRLRAGQADQRGRVQLRQFLEQRRERPGAGQLRFGHHHPIGHTHLLPPFRLPTPPWAPPSRSATAPCLRLCGCRSNCPCACPASTVVITLPARKCARSTGSCITVASTGVGSASPVVSISKRVNGATAPRSRRSYRPRIAARRSPRIVQQTQPDDSSTRSPSTASTRWWSMPMVPNSLINTAQWENAGSRSSRLSRLVFPDPRKPVSTLTGSRLSISRPRRFLAPRATLRRPEAGSVPRRPEAGSAPRRPEAGSATHAPADRSQRRRADRAPATPGPAMAPVPACRWRPQPGTRSPASR